MQTSSAVRAALVCAGLVLLGACSPKNDTKDFFDRWRSKAENSQGYSPPQHIAPARPIVIQGDPVLAKQEAKRPLPSIPVDLKLHNVDVAVALRSLAVVADINIIINPGVTGRVSIHVDKSPWNTVFKGILASNALDYSWSDGMLQVMTLADRKLELERSVLEAQYLTQLDKIRLAGNLQASVIPIRFADAKELQRTMTQMLSKDDQGRPVGMVDVDEYTNALVMQAIPADTSKVLRLVEALDRSRPQIVLKAHIVEATKETARDLGVQWGGALKTRMNSSTNIFMTPGGSNGLMDPATGQITYAPTLPPTGIGSQGHAANFPVQDLATKTAMGSIGFLLIDSAGSLLEAQLQALQDKGQVNIVSSPSISTLDNQMAFTENGEKVPYVSTNNQGDHQVRFEDAVLRLEMTPHVIDSVNLRMKIKVKKDEVDTTRNVLGNPFIIKKQTETTLIVKHGETVVISGLTKERNTARRQSVPGLGDIAGLGLAFGNDSRAQQLQEVLIFITPTILPYRDDPVEGEVATERARRQADENRLADQREHADNTPAPPAY